MKRNWMYTINNMEVMNMEINVKSLCMSSIMTFDE